MLKRYFLNCLLLLKWYCHSHHEYHLGCLVMVCGGLNSWDRLSMLHVTATDPL